MVLNVMGSNPIGHPRKSRTKVRDFFFCARRDENPGFVIDEVDDGYDIHPTLVRKKDKKKKKA